MRLQLSTSHILTIACLAGSAAALYGWYHFKKPTVEDTEDTEETEETKD